MVILISKTQYDASAEEYNILRFSKISHVNRRKIVILLHFRQSREVSDVIRLSPATPARCPEPYCTAPDPGHIATHHVPGQAGRATLPSSRHPTLVVDLPTASDIAMTHQ